MTLETFLALAVVALASYRLTRVLVDDTITASWRRWLWRHAYEPGGYDAQHDRMTAVRRGDRIGWAWEKGYQLFTCPFCVGVYVSALVWWAWFYWPWSWVQPSVGLAAVMGMQAFVSSRQGA